MILEEMLTLIWQIIPHIIDLKDTEIETSMITIQEFPLMDLEDIDSISIYLIITFSIMNMPPSVNVFPSYRVIQQETQQKYIQKY